jgi:hypothetical protein
MSWNLLWVFCRSWTFSFREKILQYDFAQNSDFRLFHFSCGSGFYRKYPSSLEELQRVALQHGFHLGSCAPFLFHSWNGRFSIKAEDEKSFFWSDDEAKIVLEILMEI